MGEPVTGQWLIMHTPDGPYVWALGDPFDDELADLVDAARVVAEFPAHDRWVYDGQGYMLFVSRGESPHHTLMARATLGTRDQLAAVDRRLVAGHREARQKAAVADRMSKATAAVAALDDTTLAQILASRTESQETTS